MDVSNWPAWRKQAYWNNIDSVIAWDMLHNYHFMSETNAEGLYDMALAGTRSEERAREMAGRRAMSRMEKNLDP